MANFGTLRSKNGPIKGRLEETLQEQKDILKQPIEKENEPYLGNYKKSKLLLPKALMRFTKLKQVCRIFQKMPKGKVKIDFNEMALEALS